MTDRIGTPSTAGTGIAARSFADEGDVIPAEITELDRLRDRGAWDEMLPILEDLRTRAMVDPAVDVWMPWIEDNWARAVRWAPSHPPSPSALAGDALVSCDRDSHELHVMFDGSDAFARHLTSSPIPGEQHFRVMFRAPIRLLVRGHRSAAQRPMFGITTPTGAFVSVDIGDDITLYASDDPREARHAPFASVSTSGEFELVLDISPDRADLRCANRLLCTVPLTETLEGLVYVRGLDALTRLEIRGLATGVHLDLEPDGTWLPNAEDAVLEAAVGAESRVMATRERGLPCEPHPATEFVERWFDTVEGAASASLFDSQFAYARCSTLLEGPSATGLSAGTKARLSGDLASSRQNWSEARQCYERAARLEPTCFELRRVWLQFAGGSLQSDLQRIEAERLLADFPHEPEALALAATLFYGGGDPDRAGVCVRRARRAGVQTATLQMLERALVARDHGPAWRSPRRRSCGSFDVLSGDTRSTEDLVVAIVRAEEALRKRFGECDPRGAPRQEIVLFGNRPQFDHYLRLSRARDVIDVSPLGVWHPSTGQILLLRDYDDVETVHTIYHEMAHAFVSRRGSAIPAWLNEAHAERFARLCAHGTGPLPCCDTRGWRDDLRARGVPDLQTFFTLDDAAYYANTKVNYAMAIALFAYLEQGTPQERMVFQRLLDGIVAGPNASALVASSFEGVDLAEVRDHLTTWLASQN